MNQVDKQYIELIKHILANGNKKEDRTGTGTLSVFDYTLRFNLNDGFPLLTTKKLHFKSIAIELLWMVSGSTNVKFLNDNNVTIWDSWVDENGELGPVYGKQWREWETVKLIKPNIFTKPESQKPEYARKNIIDPDFSQDKNNLIGKVFETKYGNFKVIKEYFVPRPDYTHLSQPVYNIQFLESGYCVNGILKHRVEKQPIKDPFFPSLFNVACLGDSDIYEKDPFWRTLYQTWFGMIRRCYDIKHQGYKQYGDKGIFVDNRWLVFSNFYQDVQLIENWLLKKTFPNDYSLDKDFHCSNKYSVNTSIWANSIEQSVNYDLHKKAFVLTDSNGYESLECSVRRVCDNYKLTSPSMFKILKGINKKHKGWSAKYVDTSGLVPRIRVHNQIQNIIAQIKHNPNSRRIVLNSWNTQDLNRMKLEPCHYVMQFYVNDNKLSCKFNMRSSDVFLGLPYNIASYALLTHIIAQQCDLQVGELIYSGGDVHIYTNHLEQVNEQIERKPYDLPTLFINNKPSSIFDYKFEDFEILNYQAHPTIKGKVAV